MESLPLEAVEAVAKYLTPQELAVCCAVSVDWRDTFNQDSLWRSHCNKDTAEYLEIAECRVEPRFETPESEDSTLSPVCRWRMCYMRETHLQNNWRRWKYVSHEIEIENTINVPYILVSSDVVAFLEDQMVSLWDVKNTPVRLGNPVRLLFNDELYDCRVLDDNIVVVVKSFGVECYSFDTIHDETWCLKYFFFIDGTETYAASDAHRIKLKDNGHGTITSFVTTETFLVSLTSNESDVLHIWDLRSGDKLKRVQCPVAHKAYNKINWKIVRPKILSTDFVVIAEYEMEIRKVYVFYVFSLTKLDFLSFQVEHELINPSDVRCVIHDKCLAIAGDMQLFFYDYTTSSLLVTLPTRGCDLLAVGNSILITEEKEIHAMFNTRSLRVEPLTVTNAEDAPQIFHLGGDVFGQFFYTFNDDREPGIWEIRQNSDSKNVIWISNLDPISQYAINESHTKVIVESFWIGFFTVITFW